MNKLATYVVAAAALIGTPAFAADMAVKMPVKAPPPAPTPVYSWTGWYVGLNAGGGWGGKIDNSLTPGACTGLVTPAGCSAIFALFNAAIPSQLDTDPRGFIGGGQVGYSYQVGLNWFAGLEADFQGSNIRANASTTNTVSGVQCER
jgi:outer membrane immunogenic protein